MPHSASATGAITDLCACNGPWQLIALRAAVRHTEQAEGHTLGKALCLFDNSPAREPLRALAAQAAGWNALFDVARLVRYSKTIRAGTLGLRLRLAELRRRLPGRSLRRLWLPKLVHPQEKLLAEAFPDAEIILYEDGLRSFADPVARQSTGLKDRVQSLCVEREHLARVSAFRGILSDQLPTPPCFASCVQTVAADAVRRALEDYRVPAVTVPGRSVLLLGQMIAQAGVVSPEAESRLFLDAARQLVSHGYRVVYKPHPRQRESGFEALRERLDSDAFVPFPAAGGLPVELTMNAIRESGLQFAAVVSAMSSTLFYAPLLFNVPAYTFLRPAHLDDAEARGLDSDHAQVARLTLEHVRPLASLAAGT